MPVRQNARDGCGVRRKILKRIVAIRHPFRVAMPALVKRIGHASGPGDGLRRLAPGMPRLSTAMQQQDRRTLLTVNVGNETVTARARE
jgi:hypothetical protein